MHAPANLKRVDMSAIEQIKAQISLLDYVRRMGLEPKKSGKQHVLHCWHHDERTPSLNVFPDGGYKCFGCGAKGDVIDACMAIEGLDKGEAVKKLASDAGIEVGRGDAKPASNTPKQNTPSKPQKRTENPKIASKGSLPPEPKNGSVRYDYLDAEGNVLCAVYRTPDKKFFPASKIKTGWVYKAPAGKRPLYGLDRLAHHDKSATVVVVEGEKAADYGQKMIVNSPVISWMGGTNAVGKTDWSPLSGRNCLIIPDADDPGEKAANELKELLQNEEANVKIIPPPTDQRGTGWDIADLANDGMSEDEQREVLLKYIQLGVEFVNNKDRFPIHVFPEKLRTFLLELDRSEGLKCDFAAMAAMTVLGAVVGNKYKVRVKTTWVTPAIIWGAVIGRSGVKKSHPVKAIMGPVKAINKRLYSDYLDEMQRYEMDLEVAGKNDKKPAKPISAPFRYDEFTVEALMAGHAKNPRGLMLWKDELMGVFDSLNQYKGKGGGDEAVLLSAFDNDRYEAPARVTRQTEPVENVCISMVGTIQFAKVQQLIENHADKGIPQRVLYCFPELEPEYPVAGTISQDWVDWWEEVILNLHEACGYSGEDDVNVIPFTPEAEAARLAHECKMVDQQRDPESGEHNNDYREKMKTYLPRLALMIAIADYAVEGRALDQVEKGSGGACRGVM